MSNDQDDPLTSNLQARVRELEAFVRDVYDSHGQMYWTALYQRSKALGLGAREQDPKLPEKDAEKPLEISRIARGLYTVHDWDKGKVFEGSLDECRSFVCQQKEARIDEANECKVREAQARGISREELQVQEFEKYLQQVVVEKFPNASAEERTRLDANVDREVAEYRQALAQQQQAPRPLAEYERYEQELRARAAAKYPIASRTPELEAKIEQKIQRMIEQHIDEFNLKKAHRAGIQGRSFDEFKAELLKSRTIGPASPALDRARQQQRAQEIER